MAVGQPQIGQQQNTQNPWYQSAMQNAGNVVAPTGQPVQTLGDYRAQNAAAQAAAANPTRAEIWNYQMPSGYQIGGSADTANQYAQQAQQTGEQASNYLNQAAQQSQGVGYQYGQALTDTGQQAQQYGQAVGGDIQSYGMQQANALGGMAGQFTQQGQDVQGRQGYQADYGQMNQNLSSADPNFNASNQALKQSGQYGQQLAGIESQEGASAAQAQLQMGLNRSQAANLAMARSGRGFGGSANALSQAATQNAAAGQQAAGQSAVLRAQEQAAYRQREAANLANAAQLQQGISQQQIAQQGLSSQVDLSKAGYNLNQQQLNSQNSLAQQQQNDAAMLGLYGLGLGAQGQSAQYGLQGMGMGANVAQQGFGQNLQAQQAGGQMQLGGLAQSGQLAQAGSMTSLAAQQQALAAQQQQVANNIAYQNQQTNLYGIDMGYQGQQAQVQQQADQFSKGLTASYVNAGLQAAGTAAGALSDRDKKKDIEPANAEVFVPAFDPVNAYNSRLSTARDLQRQGLNEQEIREIDPELADALRESPEMYYPGFSQGVGISGPNQAQGIAATDAAQAASSQVNQQAEDEKRKKTFGALGKGLKGTQIMAPQISQGFVANPYVHPQQLAAPQPMYPQLSDEHEKTGYALSDEKAKDAIDKTPAYSYRYKDPDAMGADEGLQFGVMAQDLEKTPAGRSVVKKQPDGTRMVDTSRLALLEAGAMNALSKKVAEIEKLVRRGKAA